MSKTTWCRTNESSKKQFFYWQRTLRRETFKNSRNSSLLVTVGPNQNLAPVTQRTIFFTELKTSIIFSKHSSRFPSRSRDLKGDLILEIANSAFIRIHMKSASFFYSTANEATAFFDFSECLSYGENDERSFCVVHFFFCVAVQ